MTLPTTGTFSGSTFPKMKKLICVLSLMASAFGQGGVTSNAALKVTGGPAPGATVRVCTSTSTGTPCSPLATIYSDSALSMAKTNPFAADAYGNYSYFASPGLYKEQQTFGTTTHTSIIQIAADNSHLVQFGNGTFSYFMPFSGAIGGRCQTSESYTDRQFCMYLEQVDGTAPVSLPVDPGTAVGVFHSIRSALGTKAIMGLNPLVQFSDLSHSAIAMEVDVNAGIDTLVGSTSSFDGISVVSGWLKHPFRAISIAAVNPTSTAWWYGLDLHHFMENGIKIGDFIAGGNGIGLHIAGDANEQHAILLDNTYDAIKVVPHDDTASRSIFQLTNAANSANNFVLFNNGTLQIGQTTAQSGIIRLNDVAAINFRNHANGADVNGLSKDASDVVVVGGSAGASTSGLLAASSLKVGASGATIADSRKLIQATYDCGTTTTCANTTNNSDWIVRGTVALGSASPSASTVASISPAFTSTSTYTCTASPEGATAAIAAGGIAITKVSGSSITLTGPNTVTTVIDYICIGH